MSGDVRGRRKIFTTLGASNHTKEVREQDDYYATDPIAARLLLQIEPNLSNILEPACGQGHLAEVFRNRGILGSASDLIYRGYGEQKDFFSIKEWDGDIVTNPPYKVAYKFARHGIELLQEGRRLCLFLRVLFLEGKKRGGLYREHPPSRVWVSRSRILCAKNGDFDRMRRGGGSATAYAWFVWEYNYTGITELRWFN